MMDENKKSYYAVIPACVRYDEKLPANAKLLYGEITALTNEKGYCWASNAYFAKLYNVAPQTVSNWIALLKKQKHITIKVSQKDGNSRKISIKPIKENIDTPINENLNTSSGKDIDLLRNSLIPIKENLKHNITFNTKNNNTINKEPSGKPDYLPLFSEFWELYPRKVNKKKAQDKYYKLMKDKVAHTLIVDGLKTYIKYIRQNDVKPEYIKHPTTWLNGECWNDELEVETATPVPAYLRSSNEKRMSKPMWEE
jgi:hypothetical protein